MSFADCSNTDVFLYICIFFFFFSLFASGTFCLFGDLHLKFSRFISAKQSWIWSICKVVHSNVRGCSFQCRFILWPCKCTQFFCSAIYAQQQLLVDRSFHHNAMHMIRCQKARRPFFTRCQQLPWSISDSSFRHSGPLRPQVVADRLYIAQRVGELDAFEGECCVHLSELWTALLYEACSED